MISYPGEDEGEEGLILENELPNEVEPAQEDEITTKAESENTAATTTTLTRSIIRFGLSRIARTLDTFEFAYSRFDCRNKNLDNIDLLAKYIHLRIIDLGQNQLKSCQALTTIQNLLLLNVESNLIESLLEIPDFPFLQALCVRNNKLTSSDGLFPNNSMAYLQLGDNSIADVYGLTSDVCPCLNVLELKGNKIKSLVGIDLPQLQRLYLAQNELTDLQGLDGCPNLTHLHARENKIGAIEGFPALEKLEYVNLRANNLRRFTQTALLGSSPNIKTLILKENPIASLSDYKIEILAANLNLRRLDKDPVLETEMMEARQMRHGREQGSRPSVVDDPELADAEDAGKSISEANDKSLDKNYDDWVEG